MSALALSGAFVVSRVSDDLAAQTAATLEVRRTAVATIVRSVANSAAGDALILDRKGRVNADVAARFRLQDAELQSLALEIARADVVIRFGRYDADKKSFTPAEEGIFVIRSEGIELAPGEARETSGSGPEVYPISGAVVSAAVEISLERPLSTREFRLAQIVSLIFLVGVIALLLAVGLAVYAAGRFAYPVQLLSETATQIADGDLTARVPTGPSIAGNEEMSALLDRFNRMASQLEATVSAYRRERDRGQEHLADVSHELRTPLAALRAFVDLLEGSAESDPATRKKLLAEAGRQLERMDALTANILELSRFDAGIAKPEFVEGDLRSSVRAAVEQAAAGARRRGVSLDERLPARRVMIRHDEALVGQAVANLVANALKFTPRGGTVTVTVRPLATGSATIIVEDDGVGIESAELPRIFDRFYRGTESLAAAGKAARSSGSGLGLAIVKSIVDMHAGRILVESLVGSGTKFSLTLPVDPEATAVTADEPATESGSSLTLLSVGRRAATLFGEVVKTSFRLRRVLNAEPSSSTVDGTPSDVANAAPIERTKQESEGAKR